jgi:CheY-like chemotaxis protein
MSGLMLTYLGQSYDTVEPLDLSRTCRKILPILKVSMPQEVVLETSFSSHGPIISTNVNHIQQILTNLINNSLEAIGKKSGAISLCVKTASPMDIPTKHRFPVDWESPDKTFACLEVKDTGCGIENKNIDQLFDPFYSDKFTGRGMGLPVVLGIVKTCNGAIAVNSSPGNGTTFSIFFPVSEDARRLSKKDVKKHNSLIGKSPSGKKEKGGTVLIVEDEEMLRDMAEAMLECFGFEALKAKDGVEALEIFGKHQSEIKFVFTDLTMPHMNGWETLTALRKLQPDIPVILASGYDLAHVMKGDHPELPQAFLSKPYNLNELRIAIDQAIRQKEEG